MSDFPPNTVWNGNNTNSTILNLSIINGPATPAPNINETNVFEGTIISCLLTGIQI